MKYRSQLHNGIRIDSTCKLAGLLAPIRQCRSEELWLGGGSLRDALVGANTKVGADVDVFFFNEKETSRSYETEIETQLFELTRISNLSVKNQARMGIVSDGVRYRSLWDSVAAFPDVSVAIAARMLDTEKQEIAIFAPYGIPSHETLSIRPTPRYLVTHGLSAYYSWLDRKNYDKRFPQWKIDTVAREAILPVRFTMISSIKPSRTRSL